MQKIHISAEPGQPSTFWSQDGKNWYRTKQEAEVNDIAKAVNPDDYKITKSFWNEHKKAIIISGAVITIAVVIFVLYKKGLLKFNFKK